MTEIEKGLGKMAGEKLKKEIELAFHKVDLAKEEILEIPDLIRCYKYAYYANDFFEMQCIKRDICYILQILF